MTRAVLAAVAFVAVQAALTARQPEAPPRIIDVHLHAYGAANWNSGAKNPITGKPAPASPEQHMRQTLDAMTEHNIVKAIVSGPLDVVEEWRSAAPDRILASPSFGRPGVDFYGQPLPAVDALGALFKSGKLRAIGELLAQYEGLSPSDPSLDPYLALAESLDVPVGVHTGTTFPGIHSQGYPRFRLAMGNPLLLEDLLVRHPKLRVFMAHGGEPWRRETIALMRMYQQVYLDVGAIWIAASFDPGAMDDWLREMITNGFGNRIMFGTDQMRWPEAIGMAIGIIRSSKVLNDQQRADIFYNNAARFLRLDDQKIGPR